MDYKSTNIGFSAQISSAGKDNKKPSIGFAAAIGKGIGDLKREPSIGFTAKLPEPAKPHPQLSFDF